MAIYDNSYSRMVAGLKIILPLLALVILSTLFLVSRSRNSVLSIPYADGVIEEIARDQKVGNLSYSGVAANGAAITLIAESAQPMVGNRQGIMADTLQASIETPTGQKIETSAPTGSFDSGTQTAELTDGVTLTTSTGYLIKTETITADLRNARLFTAGSITANGPLGHISAGLMVLQQQSGNGSPTSYELVFKNGVKLVYQPQQ